MSDFLQNLVRRVEPVTDIRPRLLSRFEAQQEATPDETNHHEDYGDPPATIPLTQPPQQAAESDTPETPVAQPVAQAVPPTILHKPESTETQHWQRPLEDVSPTQPLAPVAPEPLVTRPVKEPVTSVQPPTEQPTLQVRPILAEPTAPNQKLGLSTDCEKLESLESRLDRLSRLVLNSTAIATSEESSVARPPFATPAESINVTHQHLHNEITNEQPVRPKPLASVSESREPRLVPTEVVPLDLLAQRRSTSQKNDVPAPARMTEQPIVPPKTIQPETPASLRPAPAPQKTINVTIGRVEIKAASKSSATKQGPSAAPTQSRVMSLDDYIAHRTSGRIA